MRIPLGGCPWHVEGAAWAVAAEGEAAAPWRRRLFSDVNRSGLADIGTVTKNSHGGSRHGAAPPRTAVPNAVGGRPGGARGSGRVNAVTAESVFVCEEPHLGSSAAAPGPPRGDTKSYPEIAAAVEIGVDVRKSGSGAMPCGPRAQAPAFGVWGVVGATLHLDLPLCRRAVRGRFGHRRQQSTAPMPRPAPLVVPSACPSAQRARPPPMDQWRLAIHAATLSIAPSKRSRCIDV